MSLPRILSQEKSYLQATLLLNWPLALTMAVTVVEPEGELHEQVCLWLTCMQEVL